MSYSNYTDKIYRLSEAYIRDGDETSCSNVWPFNGMKYFRITGVSSHNDDNDTSVIQKMIKLLCGVSIEGARIQFILLGKNYTTEVCFGVAAEYYDTVKRMMSSLFDGVETDEKTVTDKRIMRRLGAFGSCGAVCGYPSVSEQDLEQKKTTLADAIIRGMAGDEWIYCVSAEAIDSGYVDDLCITVRDEMKRTNEDVRKSVAGQGLAGNEQKELIDYDAKEYLGLLEELLKKFNTSRLQGSWDTSIFFAAKDRITTRKLGGIIKSELGGEKSMPFTLRVNYFNNPSLFAGRGLGLVDGNTNQASFLASTVDIYAKLYQGLWGSQALAKAVCIPYEEAPGYAVSQPIKFDSAPRRDFISNNSDEEPLELGEIVYNGEPRKQVHYEVSVKSLTKHCLINGITGGGKSNTSKYLLTTLFQEHDIPFLTIESAKQEYYELGRILPPNSNFTVFTLGYEGSNSVGFRINPFERIGTVSLQSHIDYLLASFKASFPMDPPLPYILEASVYAVYKDYGWDILKDNNIKNSKKYPTIEDLYYKIEEVVDEYGYDDEIRSDVIAALQARIGSLRVGGKGAMLNTPVSYPMSELVKYPTVLELDAIGDDEVKAFVIGIIMVQLYEYRKGEMRNSTKKDTQHVLIIEEAHRLLKNVTEGSGSETQAKAVDFFCNMLAEIRSYGQAMFVADQMPSKLAPDVLKNTNLKICHRIVTKEDRELLGSSMNMSDEQIDSISMFKTGYAAVYSEGDSRPVLIKLPLMKDLYQKSRIDILNESRARVARFIPPRPIKGFDSIPCSLCSKCIHKAAVEQILRNYPSQLWKKANEDLCKKGADAVGMLRSIYEDIFEDDLKRKLTADEKICIANYIIDASAFTPSKLRAILREACLK